MWLFILEKVKKRYAKQTDVNPKNYMKLLNEVISKEALFLEWEISL